LAANTAAVLVPIPGPEPMITTALSDRADIFVYKLLIY
jgi:hypothetical protein